MQEKDCFTTTVDGQTKTKVVEEAARRSRALPLLRLGAPHIDLMILTTSSRITSVICKKHRKRFRFGPCPIRRSLSPDQLVLLLQNRPPICIQRLVRSPEGRCGCIPFLPPGAWRIIPNLPISIRAISPVWSACPHTDHPIQMRPCRSAAVDQCRQLHLGAGKKRQALLCGDSLMIT